MLVGISSICCSWRVSLILGSTSSTSCWQSLQRALSGFLRWNFVKAFKPFVRSHWWHISSSAGSEEFRFFCSGFVMIKIERMLMRDPRFELWDWENLEIPLKRFFWFERLLYELMWWYSSMDHDVTVLVVRRNVSRQRKRSNCLQMECHMILKSYRELALQMTKTGKWSLSPRHLSRKFRSGSGFVSQWCR